jgi:hypothetical protein
LRSAQPRPAHWRYIGATIAAATVLVFGGFAVTRHFSGGARPLERQAEKFVTLALFLGQQHSKEVDAYFGPSRLDTRGRQQGPSLQTLQQEAQSLRADLQAGDDASERRVQLLQQVTHFGGLLQVIQTSGQLGFDEEARVVYGMEPAIFDREAANRILQSLDALLPGAGSLAQRVESFRNQFLVPPDRQTVVFERALSECRARTLAKWSLPADEQLIVEWTHDVDAAWHRYGGHHRSTLQLNPLAVAFVGSAVDVACHEAYPGHHAQFLVMDADAGPGGVAVENTVVLLRSPISMLREGAADYGIDLAFPPAERLAFERDVLFPLAGLDPSQAEKYATVHRLISELRSNMVPILRDYRDKRLTSEIAGRALASSALVSSPQSLLSFVDELGPYVLGYTVARNKLRSYVEARSRQSGEDCWTILRRVLAQADVSVLGLRAPAITPDPDVGSSAMNANNDEPLILVRTARKAMLSPIP